MAIFRTVKRNDIGKIRTLLTVSDSVALATESAQRWRRQRQRIVSLML